MNKTVRFLLITFLTFLVSSCGLSYRVLLGVDTTPSWNTDDEIVKQAKKYEIPSKYNLVLDTVNYFNGLRGIYKNAFSALNIINEDSSEYFNIRKALKDDTQPVQFRLFDSIGVEVFKIVNCYVDPPIPMNWNVDACFDSFPPRIAIQTLNIHKFGLDFLLSNTSLLNHCRLTMNTLPKADYYGVIIWNNFFKRPSKRLIKTVRKCFQDSNESIVLIYINNQNAYLWELMDSKSKEKVKMLYSNH